MVSNENLIFNINKDTGQPSFDAIRFLRKRLSIRKMGFIGVLDPFASGVLPLFTGQYTKLIPYIKNDFKIYRFTMELGILTDTLDVTGSVLNKEEFHLKMSTHEVEDLINRNFIGLREQKVPDYSAVKINGVPSYKNARAGKSIEMPFKEVSLHSAKIFECGADYIKGEISVSSGFYVRAFARDLGENIGTFAILTELMRIKSGDFDIGESIKIDDVKRENSLDCVELMKKNMKIFDVDDEFMKELKNGRQVNCSMPAEGIYYVVSKNHINAVVCNYANGFLYPKKVIL